MVTAASWSLDGNVDVAFDMKWAKLLSLDATASARLTVNITPEAIFSQAISGSGKRPLCTPVTRLFGGMAGPIPVWVQVIAELNAGYEYTADASASVRTTVHAQKDLTFRVSLRDNQWTSGCANPPIVLTSDPIIWQLEGTASAKVYINPN